MPEHCDPICGVLGGHRTSLTSRLGFLCLNQELYEIYETFDLLYNPASVSWKAQQHWIIEGMGSLAVKVNLPLCSELAWIWLWIVNVVMV